MATELGLSSPELQGVIGFLQLEREVRQAGAKRELGFVMVNETIRLLPYRQAYWLIAPPAGGARLEIASALAEIERNAPFVVWLEELMAGLTQRKLKKPIVILDPSHIPARFCPGWAEWRFGNALCGVVRGADGQARGLLLLARDQPFSEPELDLFGRLIEVYEHAWRALDRGRVGWRDRLVAWSRDRRYVLGGVAALLLIGLIPVRQTALGQAEIVADQPAVVAAPFDGMIARLRRDQSFAALQNAIGHVYTAVGIDPLPDTLPSADLPALTAALRSAYGKPLAQTLAELSAKQGAGPLDVRPVAAAAPPPAPEPAPVATVAPEPVAQPEPTPAPPPAPEQRASASGVLVQLSADSTAESAAAEVRALKAKFAKLKSVEVTVESGKIYRVVAGPLTSQAAAEALCRSLKAQKQECFVRKPAKG